MLIMLHSEGPFFSWIRKDPFFLDSEGAIYNLSEKFGAILSEVPEILKKAIELGMKIKGVSFHVGSGGVVFDAYKNSLYDT